MAGKKKRITVPLPKRVAPQEKAAPPEKACGIDRADILRLRKKIEAHRETVKVARPLRLAAAAIAALDGVIADLNELLGKE